MPEGPDLSEPAALIGDPTRAAILMALMDGRAWTASELSVEARVGAPTVSAHLAKLAAGGLIEPMSQGRHRYFRLAGPDVAFALEALLNIAAHRAPPKRRPGPRDDAMRAARTCYDHIAGQLGVAIFQALSERRWIKSTNGAWSLTKRGSDSVEDIFGIDATQFSVSRRAIVKPCLDWGERTEHLGGALGKAFLSRALEAGWVERGPGRILTLTTSGKRKFASGLGIPRS